MKIFTAVLATETNTFSPISVDLNAFKASLYALPNQHPTTPTLCSAPLTVGRDVARLNNWELVEGTAAWADPAGLINQQTYENIRDEILKQLRATMPVDGVVLGLHGAMVAAGYDDPEGDFLSRVREIVGPDTLVCAELDPHSHLTKKRVEAVDFFVAFKEFPHTDFVEQAQNLWRIVADKLAGRTNPVMEVFDCKMIDVFPTSREPMRGFVDRIKAIEEEDPDILSISVIHGFMAGDVPEMGTKIIVVSDDKPIKAATFAQKLGEELFAMRGTFMVPQLSPDETISLALSLIDASGEHPPLGSASGPVVIADIWDNPGGGTAGDATILLAEIMERNIKNVAFGSIWDPVAVQICIAAGVNSHIPLRFGGKSAPNTGQPIDSLVRVEKIVKNAEIVFGQSLVPIGDAVHISFEGIDVILNTTRAQCFDRSMFDVMGINSEEKDILVIKSTNHFYQSFEKIAREIIYCSAGSPYPNDPRTTKYLKAPKNIWPLVDNPFDNKEI